MHIRQPEPHELPGLRQLRVASIVAIAAVAVLVVTVILPAERGIDPTGVGARLNLTRIGLLKTAMNEPVAPQSGRPQNSDEVSITIPRGMGHEVKMNMQKGFAVNYSWEADGAVFHDTHGDVYNNEGVFISYSSADSVSSDSGTISAPFGGTHGWYWENRGVVPVTITIKTEGEYVDIFIP